ncbi:SWI/SNF-related matrix-associated actin-dependent regulator of chromatin subfamily D member 1 isoform X5 [Lingula anatina]|uniref:SWI/SNF-related matrix-associated actin-dependent regulator of chromatin subfamily D member 1 isoform X5 n=1 Tax=Lingula anatina TaxID=7574 RepID=A0A1S3JJT9_LINAN|nr:SWI/SNF-related matrix-associated actin-dependent regulator of chromatin subfamily D member 1 isoform X5 [Lingula anatina]|eukprot:XP_013410680.1 SWI/SNF-related matrix-associated actin-dependent regulator of chromatin subfamily D member 1 isoform X5 [Lingula anatina]
MAARPGFQSPMQPPQPRFNPQGPPMRPFHPQAYPQGGSMRPGYPSPGPGGTPMGQMPGTPGRMHMMPSSHHTPSGVPHPYTGSGSPSTKGSTSKSKDTGPKSKQESSGGKSKETSRSKEQKSKEPKDSTMHRSGMTPAMQAAIDRRRQLQQDSRTIQMSKNKKKKKMADKILSQRVRDLVPESQAYMDLLAFERKLDSTIMRKRLDIQEALKRPMKQKRKLRIFISNTFYPSKVEEEGEETIPSWELRIEGRLLEDSISKTTNPPQAKRKFSTFFKSLVIELDKDLYGPDNHLVEWHRTPTTNETDGFQVKRTGDKNVKCTVLLMLDYQPMQFKLDPRLARLLGVHTQTRPVIINALWQYIKTHKLQDKHEREYINCDKYLHQIFQCQRMKFSEIPQRLHALLMPPDPIVINHVILVEGPDAAKKTACYDIDVEVDDTLKEQMQSFLLSSQSQQEIQQLNDKIHETVETINQLKTNREFLLSFAKDPQEFINNWLVSQTRDLKTMTDVAGNPEEERHTNYYYQPWAQEAVCRYFYGKVQQRRIELEQALSIRNT